MAIVLNPLEMQPATPRRRRCALALAAGLALACGAARADDAAWRDIETRIQYGYYTEDARSLSNLAAALASEESRDKLHSYYQALLDWRRALLAAQGAAASAGATAGTLAQRCVSEADAALSAQADFADALALRAACVAAPGTAHGLLTSFSDRRAHRDLQRARQLSPRDPRVLLVDAMSDYQLAPADGGNKERALPKLREAVAAFEAERGTAERVPGWGAAEAYLYLAHDLLDHGDPIGARDALERALLIAPQFAQARRLMAKVTAG
jgi:tetratricopeptide (TPR) repeat protein